MDKSARKSAEYLHKSIIYQMFLRPFTPEGTLSAAAKVLPHVAETGMDIVYLCPIALSDDDMRTEYWSERQKASGTNNPKNPYRFKDFYAIDPEYGTNDDLKAFVQQAHALGLRVILDIVYLHCGPAAIFLQDHPDFVVRDGNGKIELNIWNFTKLNYKSSELREYLWKNMEYFVKEFDVDGYRCDVAPQIPLDFWETGRKRMEAIKPDVFMLSEGDRLEDQLYAFDLNWAFPWLKTLDKVFNGEDEASELREAWQKMHDEFPAGARFMRSYETHGNADSCGNNRFEKAWGARGIEAAMFINFTIDGVPFVYNGAEVADSARHNVWASRFHGNNNVINWSTALTVTGRQRLEYIRKLAELRHSLPALTEGSVEWLEHDAPHSLVAYVRGCDKQKLLCVVNTRAERQQAVIETGELAAIGDILKRDTEYIVQNGRIKVDMAPYGFLLLSVGN